MITPSSHNEWFQNIAKNKPLFIAGPCSAETEEQVMQIAQQLKNTEVTIYRAGIWKPRTRPGGFEGVGEVGLPWLQNIKKETGLLVAIEVANAIHVELALKNNIDVLWIGARTTVNPFLVQEIANALRGTDKIILLKNPVNPDLSLWIGGVERLLQSNIKNIGLIHRGFSTYEKVKYRNNPEWQIAIAMQSKFPDIPFICDPSHISGRRNLIQEVSQQALNLNYDGLMIETHINPDEAWSDAAQQVTPKRLIEIVESLIVRNPNDPSENFTYELQKLRTQIDDFDRTLLQILGNRMKIAEEIGLLKKENNVSILQNKRWNDVLQNMIAQGEEKGLNQEFIINFFKAIHQESILHQEKMFKN